MNTTFELTFFTHLSMKEFYMTDNRATLFLQKICEVRLYDNVFNNINDNSGENSLF